MRKENPGVVQSRTVQRMGHLIKFHPAASYEIQFIQIKLDHNLSNFFANMRNVHQRVCNVPSPPLAMQSK